MLILIEEDFPFLETEEALSAEFGEASLSLFDGLLPFKVSLGEKFVGIADDLFLESFRQEALMG